MGDQYIKVNGAWTRATRPYVKQNGIWMPAVETWVKIAGVWTKTWQYDTTPSSIPELALEIINASYIKVSARLPDRSHDATLARIQVLAAPDVQPTSQFGTGTITGGTDNWPTEAWSAWWYNDQHPTHTSDHGDSSLFTYKYYPKNPTNSTVLPGGKWYYFSAWSCDIEGNWSAGNFARIYMNKPGVQNPRVISKEMAVYANGAGSLNSTYVFTSGMVKAHNSPVTNGSWFYSGKFNESIGLDGTPTITAATIRVSRSNDSGQPQATVRCGWHTTGLTGSVNTTTFQDVAVLGTIQKGETKTFALPTTWYSKFNTQIQGIGLVKGTAATDDLELNDLGTDLRCGEVHLTWTEAL